MIRKNYIHVVFFCVTVILTPASLAAQNQSDSLWKAGIARVVITPEQSMWMAGYAARDHESEGTMHDLWAKALALEDARGNKAVMVSTDLL